MGKFERKFRRNELKKELKALKKENTSMKNVTLARYIKYVGEVLQPPSPPNANYELEDSEQDMLDDMLLEMNE